MAQQDHDYIRVRLTMFVMCILALVLMLIFTGCAHGVKPTRPAGMPYPTKLRPQLPAGIYGLNQMRCFGGGIGGCSMSGKAFDGPAGSGR